MAQRPHPHQWIPAKDRPPSAGSEMVCGKRPSEPFLFSPPIIHRINSSRRPPVEVARSHRTPKAQPQRPNLAPILTSKTRSSDKPSEVDARVTKGRPTNRPRTSTSPAIPVPTGSPLCQRLDRDELESELSSHYFESRTEAMLGKLRGSASSIDEINNWDSVPFVDIDESRRRAHHGTGLKDSGAASNTSQDCTAIKCGDDEDDIFALEEDEFVEDAPC